MLQNINSMTINPTQLAQEMDCWTFDLDDAIKHLKEFKLRKVYEIINNEIAKKATEQNTTEENILAVLFEKMTITNDERNLKRWISPDYDGNISRDSVIKLAFALNLLPEETDSLLKRFGWDGFYMRSVKDVIYRHGLDREWCYLETKEIVDLFKTLDSPNPNPNIDASTEYSQLTEFLSAEYKKSVSTTKDSLEDFIKSNRLYFGTFRRKAYDRFKGLYDKLSNEWDTLLIEDNNIKVDALKEQKQKIHKRLIYPSNFIMDIIPIQLHDKLNNCISWLLDSEDFSIEDLQPSHILELRDGINILLYSDAYEKGDLTKDEIKALNKNIIKLQNNLCILLDTEACLSISGKKLSKLKEDTAKEVDRLFGMKAYARDSVSTTKLCQLIAIGIFNLKHSDKGNIALKKIYENIPTYTTMSQILNKSGKCATIEEVDRKLLMLAWLLSGEGAVPHYEEKKNKKENDKQKMAAFKNHLKIINISLLQPYGMPLLDPNHPFDWIVIYSLHCAYFPDMHKDANDDGDIADAVEIMETLFERL